MNVVVKDLYAKFPDVDALANAPVEEIEAIVKPCGLGRSKAKDISACMKMLRDQFDSRVPDDFDALLSLRAWQKKRESDYGRCVRKACHGNRYPLHPSGKQDWYCGRD